MFVVEPAQDPTQPHVLCRGHEVAGVVYPLPTKLYVLERRLHQEESLKWKASLFLHPYTSSEGASFLSWIGWSNPAGEEN